MVQHFIVPIDGSPASWNAFDVAVRLAQRCDSDVQLVEVEWDPMDGRAARARIADELRLRGPFTTEVSVDVRLTIGTVADELERALSMHPDAVVVMSSHGKGRSAAIVGSVAEDMLRRTFGPIILVGPNVEPGNVSGPILVAVDGSHESEVALPLAAAWAIELGTTPWIVNVTKPTSGASNENLDVFETAYSARLAKELQKFSGHPVEFDELHGRHADRAVTEYASRHNASLIVATSHGRSGLSRLVMGSVTAGFVRHATCPVVVVRLPHPNPAHTEDHARMWAY